MIPTKTLRERMREALAPWLSEGPLIRQKNDEFIDHLVQAAIDAIGDPVLIKTADSLEPTFTLRAQDRLAAMLMHQWIEQARRLGCPEEKVHEVEWLVAAFGSWPTRKWPD